MAVSRMRLHYRIVIPFVLIAIVIPGAAALVALSLIVGALDNQVVSHVRQTALLVSRSDYAFNPAILTSVNQMTGADVVTYSSTGAILASTFGTDHAAGLAESIADPDAAQEVASAPEGTTVVRRRACGGVPCYVAYRRVSTRPDAVVALIVNTSDLDSATSAITRTILFSAALGVLVMAFVSQLVAKRVTGPLERLVRFTRDVTPGNTTRRADVGDDEIGRLAGSFNDMLDRLDHAQDALVRSEKLAVTGLLAARVAHDVRNPLSSIKMQTQLQLQAQMNGEQAKPLLQAMLRDINQVESVIRDLLELARPGATTLATVPLNDAVRDVLEQLAPQFTHRKIAVETALAEALPAARLDYDRFKQAVLNVLVNAADAMAYGGLIGVTTRLGDDGSTLVLQICDDGEGVAPEMIDRVFDPFVSTKREGVGLGLVNAKAVVESHGGRIVLAPRQPRGTCVTIWLPVGSSTPAQGQGA
jgi:signal transduction histidine kinase